ncbi:MAG: hypothetical protein H6917_17825 [Novosphingobium sp.]|nr:hypothetical protein [Novosphingobium sp.]MCP5404236.1 hypothetical protein [Novosphingobium sp.]
MPGLHFFGYDFMGSQPCVRVELKLKMSGVRNTRNIDAWFKDFLKMNEEAYADTRTPPKGDRVALARTVAGRVLALYGELARAGGIPCFDKGKLLRLEADPGERETYRTTLALPVVDSINLSLFERILETAVRLVTGPLTAKPTREAATSLFEPIDEGLIRKLKQAHPFGTSTVYVCELAHRAKVPFRHIGNGNIRLGWGANSRLLNRSSTQSDSAIGNAICGNKRLTAHILRAAGFPVPDHVPVGSFEAALEAAGNLGWPVVVKPEDRDRSEGVTVEVDCEAKLREAFDAARKFSDHILVERQLPGECNRLIVAGNGIVYAVCRRPKGVRGNGEDTVARLVEIADDKELRMPPWKRFKRYILDDYALEYLAGQGFTPDTVLDEGQWAFMRPMSTDAWGGETKQVTGDVHPDNADLAIRASRQVGLTVAGVDIMTTDIAVPWHENGGAILELNYRPEFYSQGREKEARALLEVLVEGDGRIPVHLVTGEGDLLRGARELGARLASEGRKCHLTSADHTEDPDGREIPMGLSSLFDRSLALTMRDDVGEMIMVGKSGELFAHGLAVDRLESALVVDEDEKRAERTAREISMRIPAGSLQGARG